MEKLTKLQCRKLLIVCRDFILREVVPNDRPAQTEIQELFNQLLNLLD